jgi:hypothetical protein
MMKCENVEERRAEFMARLGILAMQAGGVIIPADGDLPDRKPHLKPEPQQLDPADSFRAGGRRMTDSAQARSKTRESESSDAWRLAGSTSLLRSCR